jgi:hypothetical protein
LMLKILQSKASEDESINKNSISKPSVFMIDAENSQKQNKTNSRRLQYFTLFYFVSSGLSVFLIIITVPFSTDAFGLISSSSEVC